MAPELLLATTNRGKLRELRAILAAYTSFFSLITPEELGIGLQVEETGETYAENAMLKSRAFCVSSRLVTMADDSGLEVDALLGAPGLHSARYSPQPGATDADRRRRLLDALHGLPKPWSARFRCVVAIAVPGTGHENVEKVLYAEGVCPGEIIEKERGNNGFGYDPIFLLPETNLTMAELDMTVKNQISHRAKAVQAAVPLLMNIFKSDQR